MNLSTEELALHLKGISDRSAFPLDTKDWWFEQARTHQEREGVKEGQGQDAMDGATTLVEQALGGTEIKAVVDTVNEYAKSAASVIAPPPTTDPALSLAIISTRAQTPGASPLTRDFRPSKVGFTAQMFKDQFPDLNTGDTLERFLSHHISKGDTSRNWFERFMSFAAEGQRRAKQTAANGEVETNSLGFPSNRDDRIRRRREEDAHAQEYWGTPDVP